MTGPQEPVGLSFGTAGLRASVGSGSDHMNVGTVTRASAGVADWLLTTHQHLSDANHRDLSIAVSCDARYGSDAFAQATAQVFAARGFAVTLLTGHTPTPVLAWVVKHRGLTAGVQITASHNPKADNGYKLYLAGGSQLISPADREIEAAIARQPAAASIARSVNVRHDSSAVAGYVAAIGELVASGRNDELQPRRALRIAYTSMHGVGGDVLEAALRAAGFADIHAVTAQRWPDPEFPSVDFPNPEEPGATDMLLDLGSRVRADVLIALDPDADRCMIGVPTGNTDDAGHGYRMLNGNELGPLLAKRIVARTNSGRERPVVATTLVSSQLLGAMAAEYGWDYVETKTGFKYLARAADDRPGELAFAYEEAIGTCPAPHVVADKDGIATALITATWAAELATSNRTILDELAELEAQFGVYRSSQLSVRVGSIVEAGGVIEKFVENPPAELASVVMQAEPLGTDPAEGVRLTGTADDLHVRVVARPSGTEPKAKFYLEVHGAAHDASGVTAALNQLEVDIPRAVEAVTGIA